MKRFVACMLLALSLSPVARAQVDPGKPAANTATAPVPRPDDWWAKRQEAVNARVKKGEVDLVMIGDSITQGWEDGGKEMWEKHFAPLHAVNLGFSGDRTQHVLWRLDHGNLEGIHPKAAVIMIGTNNSNGNDNTAEEIADGIKAIVAKIHEKSAETQVLVLAIFPRGEKPNPQREKIAQVNAIVEKLDDGKTVHYLDIGSKFLEADGSLSKGIMPDFLHLSPKGYQIWAEAVAPKAEELMKAEPKVVPAALIVPSKSGGTKAEQAPVTLRVGDTAPALSVDCFVKGGEVKSFEKGKVYVVEFWATWCGPCIESMPHLTELQKKYKDAVFIGIAGSERKPGEGETDKRLDTVKAFVGKQGEKMGYRVAFDSKRAMSNTWMAPAGQGFIPCAFIVDGAGKLAFIGHPDDMEEPLAKAAMGR